MKTILCFGDSNTWGYIPNTDGLRYGSDIRWPGRLRSLLNGDHHVIECGLNARTSAFDDPFRDGRNGRDHLPMILEMVSPVDLVVIMLGTNDVKDYFQLTPRTIAHGVASLIDIVTTFKPVPDSATPDVLLIAPPLIVPTNSPIGTRFQDAIEKSRQLGTEYALIAEQAGCAFLDASAEVSASPLDGVHLTEDDHKLMAEIVAARIGKMLAASA